MLQNCLQLAAILRRTWPARTSHEGKLPDYIHISTTIPEFLIIAKLILLLCGLKNCKEALRTAGNNIKINKN
jgi:hypothetical protein